MQAARATADTCLMEFKDRLKSARKDAKLSQGELAQAAGITQTSVSDLERGKSASSTHVVELAKACAVDPMWLATGKGLRAIVPHSERSIPNIELAPSVGHHENVATLNRDISRQARKYPLISWVAAGAWQESCDNFHPGDADEWIESPENAGVSGYWLEVKGSSMLPSFPEGSRILVRPEGFDLVSGRLYIARLRDSGETTFKQYLRDSGNGYLQPLNTAFPVMPITENVEIIGEVIDGKMQPSLFR